MNHITIYFFLYCSLWSKCNAQLTVQGYTNYTLSGFNVLVEDTAFVANAELTNNAIDLLENKLAEISNFNIDPIIMDSIKAVPFFMDWNTTSGAAVYHPSKTWLTKNGYTLEKAKSVEISNITNFVNWTKQNQPYMVLHELAHAYHHRVLNNDNLIIKSAFFNALLNDLYTNVSYHTGNGNYINQSTAYALTNEFEYFAELTEAYFGLNDYFPFDHTDLENYDSEGFNAAVSIWGDHILSALQSKHANNQIAIYPNPSSNIFNIYIHDQESKTYLYEVIDVSGEQVMSSIKKLDSTLSIDLTHQPKGIYFLRLIQNGNQQAYKIIKE